MSARALQGILGRTTTKGGNSDISTGGKLQIAGAIAQTAAGVGGSLVRSKNLRREARAVEANAAAQGQASKRRTNSLIQSARAQFGAGAFDLSGSPSSILNDISLESELQFLNIRRQGQEDARPLINRSSQERVVALNSLIGGSFNVASILAKQKTILK